MIVMNLFLLSSIFVLMFNACGAMI